MLSVALSTAAATRVVFVIKGALSAAVAAGAKRTTAKAQRASIAGYDTHLTAFAKRFLPRSGKNSVLLNSQGPASQPVKDHGRDDEDMQEAAEHAPHDWSGQRFHDLRAGPRALDDRQETGNHPADRHDLRPQPQHRTLDDRGLKVLKVESMAFSSRFFFKASSR
jgi:hypothetical protein